MHKLAITPLVLCIASRHVSAIKDTRVLVHNQSPVPLIMTGPGQN